MGEKGIVFEIQHFTVHDGPGIRTTVFLKGCQLRCIWCHNPEGISCNGGELSFQPEKCVGCGQCYAVCPQGVHVRENGEHRLRRQACTACGKCVAACVGCGLMLCGQEMTAEHVMQEVLKDVSFYRESGGGMTLSGGEAMLQKEFVKELVERGKGHGLHIVLETNLCYPYQWLDGIREHVNLFLVDWKESDSDKHQLDTGAENLQIYENMCRLNQDAQRFLIRCPIIPGYNDRDEHFRRIAELTREFSYAVGAELLPYHSLGISKIQRFGLNGRVEYIAAEPPTQETLNHWIAVCRKYGGNLINQEAEGCQ